MNSKTRSYSNDDFERSLTENVVSGEPGRPRPPKPPQAIPEPPLQVGKPEMPLGTKGPPGFVAIGLKPFVQKRVESVRDQLAFKRRGYMIFDWGGPPGPPVGPPFGPPEFLPPQPNQRE